MTVLDVGHGNAAVLRDEGGVVVFDTGRGVYVSRYLEKLGVLEIEALFLSHADCDHIGGATTLLLDPKFRVKRVLLNPDASKETDVFIQLLYSICESEKKRGTIVSPSLTTETSLQRNGAHIEVLYPPATTALGGVGGRDLHRKPLTSNSLSAAIRVTGGPLASVLLGGDIEFGCVDEWKQRGTTPAAKALVFPHHGGLPGKGKATEAALFAHEVTKIVSPEIVVFSIHRSKFGLPRDDVLGAVKAAANTVKVICTQLPDRFRSAVDNDPCWSLHRDPSGKGYQEGMVEFELEDTGLRMAFLKSP